jgi:hypothetical protein
LNANSSFAVSGGNLTALSNGSYCYLPVKNAQQGGAGSQGMQPSRNVTAKFTLASGGAVYLICSNPVAVVGGQVVGIGGGTPDGIVVRCTQNSNPILRVSNSNITGSIGSSLAVGAHVCSISVICNDIGYPVLVKVWMDGSLIYAGGMPTTTFGGASPSTYPYYEDGLYVGDTTSSVQQFQVQDIGALSTFGGVQIGTGAFRQQMGGETTVCQSGTTTTINAPIPAPGMPAATCVNNGAGTVTYAPASGTMYNMSGASGSLTLTQGQKATVISDGTNTYQIA